MTKKRYKTDIKWTNYLAVAFAEGFCEGEGATLEEQTDAWQYIIDNGLLSGLQGWFGGMAKRLLDQKIIKPVIKSKTICQNCGKERKVEDIYFEIDGTTEKWCRGCRASYKKDSKIINRKN